MIKGLLPPSQKATAVHVPLANDDILQEKEETKEDNNEANAEVNNPPTADNIPPVSNNDENQPPLHDNEDQRPPPLMSPGPVLQSPVARRMVQELEPHLQDPEDRTIAETIANMRHITRSQRNQHPEHVEASHPTFVNLAMCDELQDFSEFAFVVMEKYDLTVSLTKAQFDSIPVGNYKNHFTVPTTCCEAWNHHCPFQRKLWRAAIHKELSKTESNKVCTKMNKHDLPAGTKPIKCKGAFHIKQNGIFRDRLTACGHSQGPGSDCYL